MTVLQSNLDHLQVTHKHTQVREQVYIYIYMRGQGRVIGVQQCSFGVSQVNYLTRFLI